VGAVYEPKHTHTNIKGKRRRNYPEFKARVALDTMKGLKTIQEIAKEYDNGRGL
jgi:hypothetical protein